MSACTYCLDYFSLSMITLLFQSKSQTGHDIPSAKYILLKSGDFEIFNSDEPRMKT